MYPKVVRTRGLLYYPVRRSASSAIQNVLGIDFLDWRVSLAMPNTYQRFTYYRNTFDRFRSLYHNFVNPAPLGEVSFGLDIDKSTSFDTFIYLVAESQDATCDEHLQSQDWERVIPDIRVYLSMWDLELGTSLKIPPFGSFSGDLFYLRYRGTARRQFELRYAEEIAKYKFVDYGDKK